MYTPVALPFHVRALPDSTIVGISQSGDHAFLESDELAALRSAPERLPLERRAELTARFFMASHPVSPGLRRLLASRIAAKRETVEAGPSLHILVPTLQCAHSCRYCQVSRSLDDRGHTMSDDDLDRACDTVLSSPARTLTVEFQGGDPLLRFDLIQRAVRRIAAGAASTGHTVRFVVASTLHQLNADMCGFLGDHGVFLSTSIDGPAALHNRNRPVPGKDAHERTVAGIRLARSILGHDAVSALMTTTRESLPQPEAIVDEYVALGLRDIFLRPLSSYGFAKRNQSRLAYSTAEFADFYERGLARVLHWNREGVELREVYASIVLNKMLSTFDGGYVDLQSPTGAGSSVLVYNYDGFVYPSDEARMLLESGDDSLRMGRIGDSLESLLASPVRADLALASRTDRSSDCQSCAYQLFCAPNPVDAQAQFGTAFVRASLTEHCHRHQWLFDAMYMKLRHADDWTSDLFHRWAAPTA